MTESESKSKDSVKGSNDASKGDSAQNEMKAGENGAQKASSAASAKGKYY